MECFLCSKAKAMIGQVRQSSGRTAKPRAAGPGMLLPLPGKAKKRWQSQLPEIPGCAEESFQRSHSLPAMQGSTQKETGMSDGFLWLSTPELFRLVYPGAPGPGTCGRLSTFPRCRQDPGKDNLSLHGSKENLSEIRAFVIKNISEPFGSHRNSIK